MAKVISMRANVRGLSKQYVMSQLQHLGRSARIKQQDVNRAIDKITKAILEVRAAREALVKK